ncbi:selenium-dependent xanthine dehydrogenase [Thermanaeromonas sp. C210]|uniref:selenium-dependent xanthine dehydrogenase n=1 Tax=Thermanaeromonas sp. C210 TaxID=2731925 RepID=UPI00155C52F1|nr:selenium-dependent xanthine dehydrogenase [Thermanaeromonas sp. C210]GFN22289.1 selenium-dependent xanthine dehydrogenase [Thermanaeromonas sp. C210]
MRLELKVNGEAKVVDVPAEATLLDVLRDHLRLTGAKNGCGEGVCGACTVILAGRPVRACRVTAAKAAGQEVLTIEGLTPREKEIYAWAFTAAGAVQCGFCTPGMVMEAKALLDRNDSPSEEEIKQAFRAHLCRCTGYQKIVAAVQLAARALRGEVTPGQGEAAGMRKRFFRPDAPVKALGQATFVDDLMFPGMLYGAVLRPPYARARVVSLDTTVAREMPGVVVVLTAEDIPGQRYQGHIFKDWPALVAVGEEVRYVGDAIALVAAEDRETARKAVEQIKVEYEVLTPVTCPAEALAPGAPSLHPKGNILSETSIRKGNPEEALRTCAHVVSQTYRTPFTEHAFLEPESAVAVPENEGITIYTSTQGVYDIQEQVASLLALPHEKVRVLNQYVGGAFGGKEDLSVQHHAALLAWATKRPVKITLTRRESILVHPKRHAMEIKITTGCDDQGRLVAMTAEITADTGAYASLGAQVLERACHHITGPYRIPHVRIYGRAVYTNNPPAGAFRGFGVPQAAFACESQLNLLARRLGKSPWEIRWINALEPGDTLATGQIVGQDVGIKETLLAVKEVFESSPYAGIACAFKNVGLGVGTRDTGRANLAVEKGKVRIYSGAACLGQGLESVLIQIVAEATGLPAEKMEVVLADTACTPDAGITTASRQSLFTGEAVRRAAEELAQALKDHALEELEGRTFVGEFYGATDPIASNKEHPVTHVAYGYATQVVLLDEEGRVAKVVAAYDVGRAINPLNVEGQIEGGIVMGLGYALTEDFPVKDGIPQYQQLGRLGLFRFPQVPLMETILVEKGGTQYAFGAKGMGELATIPTAPAVACAYFRRDGLLRTALPLEGTPYSKK